MTSNPIQTYVFLDTETTGLITATRIPAVTELCLIAIKRRHLLECSADQELRIQHKLLMCFRPYQDMTEESVKVSGLNEQLLEQEARKHFNLNVFNTIHSFINRLQPPVCLIAHNGFLFHFPIVIHYFNAEDFKLSPNLKCSDSLLAFYDVLEGKINEDVGVKHSSKEKTFSEVKRDPYHAPDPHPPVSYKLKCIYQRVLNTSNLDPERAENQCRMMIRIAQKIAPQFMQWVDENHCAFSAVPEAVKKCETQVECVQNEQENE